MTVTVDGQTGSQNFTRLQDAYDSLDTVGLQSIVGGYTEISAATVQINLRGVPATAIYQANSPALRVIVPGPGIDVTFNGATRDESQQLFVDWLRGQGSSQVNDLLRYAAANTAIDPVAGNPNAAMNQFVAADFGRALEAAVGGGQAGFGMAARFASFTASGYNSRSLSVPLNQTFVLSENDTIELDLPLSWTNTEGAQSYGGNLGMLYRRKVFDWWTLQPSFRIGGVGSIDLGGGSGVYSAALNSTIQFPITDEIRMTIANGVTYVSTFPVTVGSYSINYDMQNTVFRNGIVLTGDFGLRLADRALILSAFAVDTRFTGDAVYIQNYQEFGVFGQWGRESPFRVGATFLTGDQGVRGFYVNTGIQF
ncbi:hypothetical protein KPL78_06055 [Roseomonas sp. HJA6]|uniref:Autotransporter outer membrane beta-barrel domain-containing protein n=1 Tax=Roseomonas alba TaxID=2846776 RepID=A0ABS7A555_9PROT|nr:hypothetical protein [Neoroseomonas alba]MBW6397405.1 hypothetical protein [Neoroseomonas alba]